MLNQCNFGCVYCTEDLETNLTKKDTSLTSDRLLHLIENLHGELNLKAIRLTGGEPLLYPNLEYLIKGLSSIGIEEIKMTSNGFLLEKKAKLLFDAGLREINISLDAANSTDFFKMTRRDKFEEVKKGIDVALKTGLHVKLNTVLVKGKNDDQLVPLLNFAKRRGIVIRFLEVMAMGHLHHKKDDFLFSQEDILSAIERHYQFKALPRKQSATANYWETTEGAVFGIIANSSHPFCSDCDRLRLDHEGNIYGCLSVNESISLIDANSTKAYKSKLWKALKQKQEVKFTGSKLSMLEIGG
ncbi:GTP 3',8-cyclase MoaA [Pelobium manganitolerans]|uniref:GTP 3',8-cyclase MoaA n=1 Tax=Pelobium manganitolerans TaxID=1842495 RepID=UPI003FA3AC1A